MEVGSLWSSTNYLAPVDYAISCIIREYDISKANITILLKEGAISESDYGYFYNLDKTKREVYIGLMLRDKPELVDVLKNGIAKARKDFFEANEIQDYEVLSIKNDAIYLMNREAPVTVVNGVNFACKSIYTSFYKLRNKEYYYYLNIPSNQEILDIKGMSSDKVLIHEPFFLDFLKTIFYSAQTDTITDTLLLLQNFYDDYINLRLSIEYYRRFDGISLYDIKEISKHSDFKAEYLTEQQKSFVDISYNHQILLELQKIFGSVYFQRTRFNGYK